jgi:Kef-type K+ transport system membrane component KefB
LHEESLLLITLGLLLLFGLVTYYLGRHTPLPRVTLLLIFGFLIGPSTADILPAMALKWFPTITKMALVMVGFLLGGKLTLPSLRQYGRLVLWISLAVVIATTVLMLGGLLLIGIPASIALLLAGVAPSTAPAATADVVHELRARGRFSDILLGIVAVDDAWGLIIFSIVLVAVQAVTAPSGFSQLLLAGAWDLGGALLVGTILGVPMAYLTGRIRPGEPTLAEALGMVFLCGGVALWLEVSFLLASMAMGFVVANLAHHHTRPFHAIEGIEWPFMVLFFIFAGASLIPEFLFQAGLAGTAYIILRVLGRIIGAWIGSVSSKADPMLRRWMGLALMPQAGIALGLALMASQQFPQMGETVLPVVIGSTVVFELGGPVLTRRALLKAGEVHLEK